ncbi:uncharacterized protein ACDP82_001946 [Pangshura tecta]
MERGARLRVGDRRERRARGTPDVCGTGSADLSPQVFIKTEQEEEPCPGWPPEQRERGILHAPGTGECCEIPPGVEQAKGGQEEPGSWGNPYKRLQSGCLRPASCF